VPAPHAAAADGQHLAHTDDPRAALAKRAIRAHFGKAARSYGAAAALQHEVEDRLLERLDAITSNPTRVLDVGCGPGRGVALLKARYPNAHLLALDLALPMLQAAAPEKSWWKPFAKPGFDRINADAMRLPLADGSIDLLYSNLCIQWCAPLRSLFTNWRRVLRPGAPVLISTFGPDTLKELREAWAQVDTQPHVNQFLDMHDIGDQLLATGYQQVVLETDRFTVRYADVGALLRELKAIGASNAMQARRQGLGGASALKAMTQAYPRGPDGRISCTYEVIYAQCFAPPNGSPIRDAAGEIASVPISAIKKPRSPGQ
jgi:malonyl-CoA O-methyltransferase